MKSYVLIAATAALISACATAPDTRAVAGFDPAATTFTGWVRVVDGEFQMVAEQRQLRDRLNRPCISGTLPRPMQDTARELNGSKVEFTGQAVAWADRGDRATLQHEGSLITNTCGGAYVIKAETVRVLR